MTQRDSLLAWFPVVLKYTGLGMTILMALFWAATFLITGSGAVEPALLALFGSMVGIGEAADAIRDFGLGRPNAADVRAGIPRATPSDPGRPE